MLEKRLSERKKNPYPVAEMLLNNNANVPLIYGGGAYVNGPELRDPRLNLEYTLFIKNKVDGEKFWVKYISGNDNNTLLEVRWDLFEDAMLCYL